MESIVDSFFGGMHDYVAHEVQDAAEHHLQHSDHDDGKHEPGVIDVVQHMVLHMATHLVAETAWGLLENLGGAPAHHETPGLQIGTLEGDGFTHQTTGFTCAVVSQQMILHQFHLIDPMTGEPVSESHLVYDATAHGWLTDQGTPLSCMGNLLEHYGIACHEGHDWHSLVKDLTAGHQVMIAVNADPLWNEHGSLGSLSQLLGGNLNHALVLKGMQLDEHGHVVVVVNDPGQPDGAGVEYPLERFQAAVGGGALHYVATDEAPPGAHLADIDLAGLHLTPDADANANNSHVQNLNDMDGELGPRSDQDRYEYFRSI